mgnify:FL=1
MTGVCAAGKEDDDDEDVGQAVAVTSTVAVTGTQTDPTHDEPTLTDEVGEGSTQYAVPLLVYTLAMDEELEDGAGVGTDLLARDPNEVGDGQPSIHP